MNISNLFKAKKIIFSLEIFPPKKESSVNVIYNTLLKMRGLPADFISVTYGAGGSEAQRQKTWEIASLIRSTYHVEPVAHLTCVNSDEQEIIETLQKLKENQIQNVLALRGDINPDVTPKCIFRHASDLAAFIRSQDLSFNVIGACYPECHFESDNLDKDIENLKFKIDNGVTHLISQLFFDNNSFYRFLDKVHAAGISVPIQAGLMPIVNKNQIEKIVTLSGASVPAKLSGILSRYSNNRNALKDAGILYATEQIFDLISHGVHGIHLYTMNNVETAVRISENIQNIISAENNEPEYV